MTSPGPLLSVKEIAAGIQRSRHYVQAAKKAMVAAGVPWPTNRCSMEDFLAWVTETHFRCTGYGKNGSRNFKSLQKLT